MGTAIWGLPAGLLEKHGAARNFQSWLRGQTHVLGPVAALACAPLLLAAWRVGGAQILLE